MPKISVIAPVYNSEKYIKRFIDSILTQTLKDIELIFVDDKAIDNSMQIVEDYSKKDNRIKIIYSEKNEGPMIARQKGVMIAEGEFVNFSDSDDELPLNALELLYKKAVSDESDIVAGTAKYVKTKGEELWECKLSYGNDYTAVITSLLKAEYRHNLCAKIIKTEFVKDYDNYLIPGMKYFEDYLLMYQIVSRCKKFSTINDIVYIYYQNASSSTQAEMSPKRLEDAYKAYSYVCGQLSKDSRFEKMAKSYVQIAIKNQMISGYNKDGLVDMLVTKYGFKSWVTTKEIFRCNNILLSLKLLLRLSFLGRILFKIKS